MREIQSAGGPLIGLDRDHLHLWSGIFGKSFIGEGSQFATDYDATGYLIDGRPLPPCNISKLQGSVAQGFLITMPYDTAVLQLGVEAVYIAQVRYCEPDWGFHRLTQNDFSGVNFNQMPHVMFSSKFSTYVVFDAACKGSEIGDDYLTFDLNEGHHVLRTAVYQPDPSTGLILCKIDNQ